MKGSFFSTAGRTAATKVRLDTLCPEPPLQLASPPGTPLILTRFLFLSCLAPARALKQCRQGKFVAAVRSNRSAEGQGEPLPSAQVCPHLSRPGEQQEEKLWGSVVPAWHPPSGGVDKERGTGGTEMQDRLHILEDLNMLYIRQMALSLEVMSPPLEYTSSTSNPAPVSGLLFFAGPDGRGRGLLNVGRGTGGSVCAVLGAVCGHRLSSVNQSILLAIPISGSSLGGCGYVFWGQEPLLDMGRREEFNMRGLQEGYSLPREGGENSGARYEDSAWPGGCRELFFNLFVLRHIY